MGSAVCTVIWNPDGNDDEILKFLKSSASSFWLDDVDSNLGYYQEGKNSFVCGREGLKLLFGAPNFKGFIDGISKSPYLRNVEYRVVTEHLPL